MRRPRLSVTCLTAGGGLQCVGRLNPGFGTIEEMSQDHIFAQINASSADLLAVFLSSSKAQAWLLKNHDRIRVPVRFDFGGTINFQAGLVARAPLRLRKLGLEWLWRIKEEPYLWHRYWANGLRLIGLFLTCVIPLIIARLGYRVKPSRYLTLAQWKNGSSVTVKLSGDAVAIHVERDCARSL
jgi:N-acetylglucosaminyldiphosphoundecaprenol N-acetyl-beta-D-mannosaminyltransferase